MELKFIVIFFEMLFCKSTNISSISIPYTFNPKTFPQYAILPSPDPISREAQICYASISTVTDYDVWAEKPVTAKEVIETLSKNVELTKKLLTELIDKIPVSKSCSCEKALEEAEF